MFKQSALNHGLILCLCCHKLCRVPADALDQNGHKPATSQARKVQVKLLCPRCLSPIHPRQPQSLGKTWALLISALICFIPANLYPMMIITELGSQQFDTIISGVFSLARTGMLPIAIIVFIASIAVPLLKISAMTLLLASIQRRWRISPRQRTLLYRIIDWIGRWSMLDLFVIAILVAILDMQELLDVSAGPASAAFACVVILTMLAANSFDPRLLWDMHDTEEIDKLAQTPKEEDSQP